MFIEKIHLILYKWPVLVFYCRLYNFLYMLFEIENIYGINITYVVIIAEKTFMKLVSSIILKI